MYHVPAELVRKVLEYLLGQELLFALTCKSNLMHVRSLRKDGILPTQRRSAYLRSDNSVPTKARIVEIRSSHRTPIVLGHPSYDCDSLVGKAIGSDHGIDHQLVRYWTSQFVWNYCCIVGLPLLPRVASEQELPLRIDRVAVL